MNSAYIGKLMALAEHDSRIIHLLADSGTGFDEMFRRNYPNQMYNFGIAEENMVSAAAGMATAGKIPFVFTAGAFLAYRSMEFIRDDVCFQNLNVKIIGMGSGLSWSSLGPTHHTTEDISVLRALPNLMLLSPATPYQVGACVQKAYEHTGPVYIKVGMNHEKEYFSEKYVLPDSGMDIMCRGADLTVFVTGSVLQEVMEAADALKEKGVSATVIHVAALKPFDSMFAIEAVSGIQNIFTVEEHNIYGGLGSILSEAFAYHGGGRKIVPIGLQDCFAEGYGTHAAVRKANGLDCETIYRRIMESI